MIGQVLGVVKLENDLQEPAQHFVSHDHFAKRMDTVLSVMDKEGSGLLELVSGKVQSSAVEKAVEAFNHHVNIF